MQRYKYEERYERRYEDWQNCGINCDIIHNQSVRISACMEKTIAEQWGGKLSSAPLCIGYSHRLITDRIVVGLSVVRQTRARWKAQSDLAWKRPFSPKKKGKRERTPRSIAIFAITTRYRTCNKTTSLVYISCRKCIWAPPKNFSSRSQSISKEFREWNKSRNSEINRIHFKLEPINLSINELQRI